MLPPEIELTRGDIRNPDTVAKLFTGIGNDSDITVIHAAGLISISGKQQKLLYDVNVGGTKTILDAARKYGCKRFVYVSSTHALPDRHDGLPAVESTIFSPELVQGAYSRSKALATSLVLDAAAEGLDACVVHPAGMIGPNDFGSGLMSQMISDYLNGILRVCVPGGYDFADVRDVAAGILSAAENGKKGECYILSNRYIPAMELLDMVHELTGKRKIRTVLPLWLVKPCIPFARLYFRMKKEKPLITADSLSILSSPAQFSHEKATNELGYAPRELQQTLTDMIEFLRSIHRIPLQTMITAPA
jgi:dihydroflavonol-4-reductase